jgi:coenzyme F420 hydrogenase subunit beta
MTQIAPPKSIRLSTFQPQDIVSSRQCVGCGLCAAMAPNHLTMVDTLQHTRRPVSLSQNPVDIAGLAQACPGILQTKPQNTDGATHLQEWGQVLEVWEGHACDPQIRLKGSSGGVVTALALYAIEAGHMSGVVHTQARTDAPLLNKTVFSTNRSELLAGAGSRYAPASPCDGLNHLQSAQAPGVFIGKPCDVAGAAQYAAINPRLAENLGLTIAVFCAGTPSYNGTLALLKALGVKDPQDVQQLRYRGQGWPGTMQALLKDGTQSQELTYDQGWGQILQKHRPWRCHVCPDHTGESADLSVGDPWYKPFHPGEPGRSMVIVRTERGRQLLRQAVAAGYVSLQMRDPKIIADSQKHLLRARRSAWGRIAACRIMGMKMPRFPGMGLFSSWLKLSFSDKTSSIIGTFKRIFSRRLTISESPSPLPTQAQ